MLTVVCTYDDGEWTWDGFETFALALAAARSELSLSYDTARHAVIKRGDRVVWDSVQEGA